jgi:AraC family transcriptional regulator of adaptative response/methylated-DNA-[protein]-cysteine methyltransferase
MTSADYLRIERAILFLERNFKRQPELADVAAAVGLSEFHFQRLFRRWAGVSPKRFLQFLTATHAGRLLRQEKSVLATAYDAGLSGPGRLHDLMVSVYAATPGEMKSGGASLGIRFGIHESPFGQCLIAATARGITSLAFLQPASRNDAVAELRARWPNATIREDPAATRPLARRIFAETHNGEPITLLLRGTNFQLRVWEALLRIPPGHVSSYEQVARDVGSPAAGRAVGRATGQNPIAWLIPCHRVIRKSGVFGDYHWGATRKTAMLAWEAVRQGKGKGKFEGEGEGEGEGEETGT